MKNNNTAIYEAIRSLARKICSQNETYLRADLAFELKKFGISDDSIDVSRLVFEAYKYYNNDSHIKAAFVTNDNRFPLVDEYKMTDLLNNGQTSAAMQLAKQELDKTAGKLSQLERDIANAIALEVGKAASGLMDTLAGTGGVKEIRAQAAGIFERYSQMVARYREGEDSVRHIISDFTTLRTDIGNTYREYAMRLIDIYGDSVKMVAPDLFDFSQVQFLDVDSMFKHTELEYNRISDSCSTLIGQISDSFKSSVESSMNAYQSAGQSSKGVGLVMAGLGMVNHYMEAAEQTARLGSELTTFKTNVKHDATVVKADLGRLLVIYKTLNDVAIPKADIYLQHAARLISSDIKAITDALYNNADIKPLEEQRLQLLARLKALDGGINDHLQHIDVYQSLISDLTTTLDSKRQSYRNAKSRKPSKPFFLINILTFGSASKRYARNYAEWDEVCFPLVREYESNMADLKLNKEELTSHEAEVKELQNERKECARKLDALSKQIRDKAKASPDVKLKMLPHLRSVVALLRLGREIMETKLDKRLVGTLSVPDFRTALALPADIEGNLTQFTALLADNVKADKNTALDLLNNVDDCRDIDIKNRKYSDEEVTQVEAASNAAVQKGVSLLNSIIELNAKKLHGSLAAAEYDRYYENVADEFRKQINAIDNKNAFVREVMRRANLATSDAERKQALLALSELSGQSLSERDFNAFLNGEMDIQL